MYVIQQLDFGLQAVSLAEPRWIDVEPHVEYATVEAAQAVIHQFHPGRRSYMRISEE